MTRSSRKKKGLIDPKIAEIVRPGKSRNQWKRFKKNFRAQNYKRLVL